MSVEESYNIILKLIHNEGVISKIKLLKSRSKLSEDILEKLNKVLSDSFTPKVEIVKTNTELGIIGEQFILAHLNKISNYNSEFLVYDTSSCKDHGDICVEYKGIKTCIEVKNYTNPIPSKEIEKYHNSLSLPDYDIGLIISINEYGFAKEYKIKNPIDIKIINGKPSAYISNVDPEIIYPTINILMAILVNNKQYNNGNLEDIQLNLDKKTKNLLEIYEKTKEVKTLIESQKKSILKLESMINEIQAYSIN